MAIEYKISTILRSGYGVEVLARFYNTTVKKIKITRLNHNKYPLDKIGDVINNIKRTKHKSNPEVTYNFSADTTDEQINQFLYKQASRYGKPINKKVK